MGETLGICGSQQSWDGLRNGVEAMRVLVLMTDSYAGFGGVAQYNRDVLDSLNSYGGINEIRSFTRLPRQIDVGFPEKLEESCVPNKISYLATVLMEVIRWRPDVILCGHMNLLPAAAVVGMLGRFPIILEIYGIDAWQKKGRAANLFMKRVNHVISISRYTKQRFLSWSLMDEAKVDVVPNAIHLNRYVMKDKPSYLIQRYSLENKRVLLTLGRLSAQERYKGHDRIISLMPKLIERYPDLIYVIAGEGDDCARLETLCEELKVEEFVKFVGRVAEDEILDHYNVADAFAMPSTGEGFGFVFLEAAACGLPVLGGGVDGSADALLDGELGIMVNPENIIELFEGLIRLLEKPVKNMQLEKLKGFSFDRFRSQILAGFQTAIKHEG